MQLPKDFTALVEHASQLNLYKKLIIQLNKDLQLANIDLDFDDEVLPTSLKYLLHETVFNLIQDNFSNYLNLLYISDVSEEKVKLLDGLDTAELAEEVTFLIFQREWQKVWFKNTYS